ncbi:hypothetical protein RHMOL_Rhmol04G0359300 [Rhododendron molle]|uniref:Uncharacterized protein n=1 Tax=Rhododendron molle TaxID=49168 RepID=A0ACC0P957_RHOML|nr:hypothetical protein RHMOL_Rhmol04G0359300 [Rhododendron molle]
MAMAMAKLGWLKELAKRKGGMLLKWGGSTTRSGMCAYSSSSPARAGATVYEKKICFCVGADEETYNPRKWYMLDISSSKDKEKEEEEKRGEKLLEIPTPEFRGAYLAYHHEERHSGEDSPVLSPFLELEKGKSSGMCDVLSAVVGSTVFRIGGQLCGGGQGPHYSREVLYCRSPEEGWKTGPQTISGRSEAAVVALHGKIYVFGGHDHPPFDPEAVWGESLDTTFLIGEEGTGGGQAAAAAPAWSRLPDPPSHLGFSKLFAAALGVHEFSGKILVGCTFTDAMCLYDVTQKSWESMDPLISDGGAVFRSPPIVVGTAVYWISYFYLYVYDFVTKKLVELPVGDSEICRLMMETEEILQINLKLLHLAGDIFALLWVGEEVDQGNNSAFLHCAKIQVSTKLRSAFVLSCHCYRFGHLVRLSDMVRLLGCLPL